MGWSYRMMTRLIPVLLLAACGADPINYSAPVGIVLKAKSGDVNQSAVTEQKDITTESGNPYGAFTNDATAKLGGRAPSRIEIDQLTLTLGGQSTGVSALEQVLTGDVDVAFLVNDSNNTYDAGHVISPTGVGPVDMTPSFDWSAVAATDQAKILGGGFKVVLRGPAAATFSTSSANASLQTTFTFTAFQ
jgi:hypothetical protein